MRRSFFRNKKSNLKIERPSTGLTDLIEFSITYIDSHIFHWATTAFFGDILNPHFHPRRNVFHLSLAPHSRALDREKESWRANFQWAQFKVEHLHEAAP